MDTVQSTACEPALSEGARMATGDRAGCGAAARADLPDPEVPEKKPRRRRTVEYKLRILREANACQPGELGAFLRREGLYSSTLRKWRKQRDSGILVALSPRKRGRKADPDSPLRKKLAARDREIERLKKRLRQAETIIDVQKKVSEMLGIDLETKGSNGRNE